MSKSLLDLLMGKYIPSSIYAKMEKTEPGWLSHAIGEMMYARSHDEKMCSIFPEKVYIGSPPPDEYMVKRLGSEGNYIKTDVVLAKLVELLDALALQYALENRTTT